MKIRVSRRGVSEEVRAELLRVLQEHMEDLVEAMREVTEDWRHKPIFKHRRDRWRWPFA